MGEGSETATARWVNASVIGAEASRATWALAARERLLETAREYHATISYKDLADFVQERSLVRTTQLHMHWIGDVLSRVSVSCIENGEPLLSSLCVDSRGRVGPGYTVVVEDHRREPLPHPDEHAARERLQCYRYFGADLPEGGGVVAMPLVEQPARADRAPRVRRTTAPVEPKPRKISAARVTAEAAAAAPLAATASICPVHFTVLPATGVCDDCE